MPRLLYYALYFGNETDHKNFENIFIFILHLIASIFCNLSGGKPNSTTLQIWKVIIQIRWI